MKNIKYISLFFVCLLAFVICINATFIIAEEEIITGTGDQIVREFMSNVKSSAEKGENLGVPSQKFKGSDATLTDEPNGSYEAGEKFTLTSTEPIEYKGSSVSEIKITVERSERLTDRELYEIANKRWEYPFSSYEEYRSMVENDLLDGKYAELMNAVGAELSNPVEVLLYQNADGTWVGEWPDELGDPDLYAISGVAFKTADGQTYGRDLYAYEMVYFDQGLEEIEPEKSATDENPKYDGNSGNAERAYAYPLINSSYYTHLEPDTIVGDIVAKDDKYNVTEAIPTSEMLKVTATADESLYEIEERRWTAVAGVENVTITTKINYFYERCPHWTHETKCKYLKTDKYKDCNCNKYQIHGSERYPGCYGTETKTHTTKYSTSQQATFYDVPVSNIYPSTKALFTGLPTDNSSVLMNLTGTGGGGPQTLSYQKILPSYRKTANTYRNEGEYNSKEVHDYLYTCACNNIDMACLSAAQNALKGNVNYSYKDLKITKTYSNGVTPKVGTVSNSLEKNPDTLIADDKANGNYSTNGIIWYANGTAYNFDPNDVFVHTPVVNNTKLSVEKFVNQKVTKDANRTYLQLDKSFTITIPNSGQHISVKGYGNRRFNSSGNLTITPKSTSWGEKVTIKIPFDVYRNNSDGTKEFIAANTLQQVKCDTAYTYTIPVWVWEGNYTIETRVIAENQQNDNAEDGANLNYNNYIAKKDIPVEIVGKIYDLRVSSSNDPGWYNNIKNNYVTAEEFPFGQKGQNKITSYKYAPKLGYTFVFDFKTKGRKSNSIDVSAYPEFYFVSKNGGNAEKVDLYYNTVNEKAVKINESDTRVPLSVNYSDTYMKVSQQEKIDSNKIYKTKYNYNLSVNIGTFANMHMPHSLRLCYNNFEEYVKKLYGTNSTKSSIIENAKLTSYSDENGGGENIVIGSVGHWYAGYRLPASTIAVTPGTKVTASNMDSVKKKDGYILVKMNIKTNYETWEYLKYTGPEALNEGSNTPTVDWEKSYDPNNSSNSEEVTLPNGKPAKVPNGTIIIYDSDLRSTNDAESTGTH